MKSDYQFLKETRKPRIPRDSNFFVAQVIAITALAVFAMTVGSVLCYFILRAIGSLRMWSCVVVI